jgi:Icc-related predicted phosphoesterase
MARKKILAIGDIHGDLSLVRKISERIKKESIGSVILAGDITFSDRLSKNIIGPLVGAGAKVFIIPGNHDSLATIDFITQAYENVINLHGYGFIENGIGIFGAGGADIGINKISEKDFFSLLKRGFEKIKDAKTKIMVTHMHPKNSKSEIFGFEGSRAIRKAIYEFKPDIAIHAHIHEAGGIEEILGKTIIFNVSKKERVFEL